MFVSSTKHITQYFIQRRVEIANTGISIPTLLCKYDAIRENYILHVQLLRLVLNETMTTCHTDLLHSSAKMNGQILLF